MKRKKSRTKEGSRQPCGFSLRGATCGILTIKIKAKTKTKEV